jgi:hypothetical protein
MADRDPIQQDGDGVCVPPRGPSVQDEFDGASPADDPRRVTAASRSARRRGPSMTAVVVPQVIPNVCNAGASRHAEVRCAAAPVNGGGACRCRVKTAMFWSLPGRVSTVHADDQQSLVVFCCTAGKARVGSGSAANEQRRRIRDWVSRSRTCPGGSIGQAMALGRRRRVGCRTESPRTQCTLRRGSPRFGGRRITRAPLVRAHS